MEWAWFLGGGFVSILGSLALSLISHRIKQPFWDYVDQKIGGWSFRRKEQAIKDYELMWKIHNRSVDPVLFVGERLSMLLVGMTSLGLVIVFLFNAQVLNPELTGRITSIEWNFRNAFDMCVSVVLAIFAVSMMVLGLNAASHLRLAYIRIADFGKYQAEFFSKIGITATEKADPTTIRTLLIANDAVASSPKAG